MWKQRKQGYIRINDNMKNPTFKDERRRISNKVGCSKNNIAPEKFGTLLLINRVRNYSVKCYRNDSIMDNVAKRTDTSSHSES